MAHFQDLLRERPEHTRQITGKHQRTDRETCMKSGYEYPNKA